MDKMLFYTMKIGFMGHWAMNVTNQRLLTIFPLGYLLATRASFSKYAQFFNDGYWEFDINFTAEL
jgi:hypothetical protein